MILQQLAHQFTKNDIDSLTVTFKSKEAPRKHKQLSTIEDEVDFSLLAKNSLNGYYSPLSCQFRTWWISIFFFFIIVPAPVAW